MGTMKRMVVLTGGSDSNLQYARSAAHAIKCHNVEVMCVISPKRSDPIVPETTRQILCPDKPIFRSGKPWKNDRIMKYIHTNCEVGISTGFDYIIHSDFLNAVPVINCHPAALPFNRGCHHSFWGIMEGTPLGGTIHWMVKELDAGPIIDQEIFHDDGIMTAQDIQEKSEKICAKLIRKNLGQILLGKTTGLEQKGGSYHSRSEIIAAATLEDGKHVEVGRLFDLCRATACKNNGFFIVKNNKKFLIRIHGIEEVNYDG